MDSQILKASMDTYERPAQTATTYIENILVADVIKEILKTVVYSTSASPFIVSQVCSRWRDLALQDSTLWANISITEACINQNLPGPVRDISRPRKTGRRQTALPCAFPRTQIMLQRSRTQLLDVSVVIPQTRWDIYHSVMLSALLKHHIRRFRTLRLQSGGCAWQHHALLLDIMRDRALPNLVDLSIRRWYAARQELDGHFDVATYAEPQCNVPSTRFSFARDVVEEMLCPKLERITLTGSYQEWRRFFGRNLVSITIAKMPLRARPSSKQLRRMLEMSSATVTTLELTGSLPYEFGKRNGLAPVVLTNLVHLRLQYTMPVELEVFQSSFRVPALKQLYIVNMNVQNPIAPMESFNTLCSFAALLSTFPFTQLEDFALHGAQFGPPPRSIPTEDDVLLGTVKLPIPFKLLQQLKNAKKVRFENPDAFLLAGMLFSQLDMIPKDSGYRRDPKMPPTPVVLNAVEELCFEVNTDAYAHRGVLKYLRDRLEKFMIADEEASEEVYVGTPVEVLRLTFPLVSKERFEREDWSGTGIARRVVVRHGPASCIGGE